MSGWRDIESAPKDGTPILIWDGNGQEVVEFLDGEWRDVGDLPRHAESWQPLPDPPD